MGQLPSVIKVSNKKQRMLPTATEANRKTDEAA
jgi:hypothetical protein